MIQYTILESSSLTNLERLINGHAEDGWVLVGPVNLAISGMRNYIATMEKHV